jgi:hypothetical protein
MKYRVLTAYSTLSLEKQVLMWVNDYGYKLHGGVSVSHTNGYRDLYAQAVVKEE